MSELQDTILGAVTPENPGGPNLEYDNSFMALERAMQGKPEQQIGTTIVPAQEPDWPEVRRLSLEVLTRSKDLRAALGLAQALLRTGGFLGFADGLSALRGLVERYWETLHPQPDADDPDDHTIRVNILANLTEPSILSAVRTAPLFSSRAAGRFCLKDIEIAAGDAPAPPGADPATMGTIEAAALDTDLAALEGIAAAAGVCFESVRAVEVFVAERVGAERAPALGKLSALLKRAAAFLSAALARRQPAANAGASTEAGNGEGMSQDTTGSLGRSAGGEIQSREDVLRALEKICRYYAKHEPSSPIPMFMERCQRLVSMTFVDIVRDLAPDALSQVDILRGGAK